MSDFKVGDTVYHFQLGWCKVLPDDPDNPHSGYRFKVSNGEQVKYFMPHEYVPIVMSIDEARAWGKELPGDDNEH